MDTKDVGADGLPSDLPVVQTFERMKAAFPGEAIPAVVVVRADDVNRPGVVRAIRQLRARAIDSAQMNGPINVTVNERGDVAVVTIPMVGSGTDDRSIDALATLRERLIP